jgi:FMN phosphatase YigB (HAD superfamily)
MKRPIRAILFDLDGTLLDNDMGEFLPPYFRLLTARVAHLLPPQDFMAHLMQATEIMMANDGRATNEELFANSFYPLAGRPRHEIEPLFVDFYNSDFLSLKRYTKRKPEARQVVQRAFDLGYDVVVATNPLFPAMAVQHRLEWAGIADFPFRLVTSYENSRATKPNLLYFEQILETLGHPAKAALVVGDEDMDMVAAHLGCLTFLVPGSRTELSPTTPQPAYRGTLNDVGELLETLARRPQIEAHGSS